MKKENLKEVEVNINVGNIFRLELVGQSSGGYLWEYVIAGPQKIVNVSSEMVGTIFQPPPGGPSLETFKKLKVFNIAALETGITYICLFLRHQWEGDKPPLRELCLKILVSK